MIKPTGAPKSNTPSGHSRRGIVYMLCGTAIVPVMDAIAKHLGSSMSPLQITWGRFFFQFLIMGTALLLTVGYHGLIPKRPSIHALRGLLLATATTFFFFGLQHLPLADAIAIFFVEPMMLTLISALFLGESIGWHRQVAVLFGFLGAMMIIKPGTSSFTIASFFPLCAALFFSSYLAVTKAVANVDHPMTMQFASGLAATILLGIALGIASHWPLSLFAPSSPTAIEWAWLAAIGLIAAVGHLLVVMGFNRAPASLLAPFGYIEIIAATALGWLIFGDWPDILAWLGIVTIISSGAYMFYREQL